MTVIAIVTLLFWLIVGHAVMDFSLQGEAMAKFKNRQNHPDSKLVPSWPYWLGAHALEHGACVTLATGSIVLGLCETLSHGVIDFGKCENWYGPHIDQGLHLSCKAVWVSIVLAGC